MSSNIEIHKICEYCNNEFIAKTTVTRFCSHRCSAASYKKRKRDNKIGWATEETNNTKLLSLKDLNFEVIKQKDFLSIKEAYTLLGISERTLFRIMKSGIIPHTKLGKRTIIKRSEIDKIFAL